MRYATIALLVLLTACGDDPVGPGDPPDPPPPVELTGTWGAALSLPSAPLSCGEARTITDVELALNGATFDAYVLYEYTDCAGLPGFTQLHSTGSYVARADSVLLTPIGDTLVHSGRRDGTSIVTRFWDVAGDTVHAVTLLLR